MKLNPALKYTTLTLLVFIIGLSALIISDPKWCYDEHLRHTFNKRILSTPLGSITDEESKPIRWGIEYSGYLDKSYADAYLTSEKRKIIRIHPSAAPALTVGFNIFIEIDSPLDNLEVEYDENSTIIQIGGGLNLKADKISNYSIRRYAKNRHRGHYYTYKINYMLSNETIKKQDIKDGDIFSATVPFSIDGESYSYSFSTKLWYEKRQHTCFGIPGMP